MKKTLIIIGLLIVLGIAYWLLSPLWRVTVLDEELPGFTQALERMSPEIQEDFIMQMKEMESVVIEQSEPMMPENIIISTADLVPESHEVEGRALLIEANGQNFLRFEDLDTVNGPDLRIYLSSDLDVDDAIDLGPIRATQGNVNYQLPDDIDLDRYRNALIWCRAFGVLFSYGEL